MKSIKLVVAVLLFSLTSGISFSQISQTPLDQDTELTKDKRKQKNKKSPEERAKKKTEKLTKALDLSDEQADEIYNLSLRYAEVSKGDREARKESRQAHHDAIKAILNDAQAEKFEKMKSKAKDKGKKRKRGKKMKSSHAVDDNR